jgi:hypothetical protein
VDDGKSVNSDSSFVYMEEAEEDEDHDFHSDSFLPSNVDDLDEVDERCDHLDKSPTNFSTSYTVPPPMSTYHQDVQFSNIV